MPKDVTTENSIFFLLSLSLSNLTLFSKTFTLVDFILFLSSSPIVYLEISLFLIDENEFFIMLFNHQN